MQRIHKIIYKRQEALNGALFGQYLFEKLKKIYFSDELQIDEFGRKMYSIWNTYLPDCLAKEEPFWTLSYADDCLSYGDEKQTRELYEKAFDFYQK
ncbi:hypothetical protein IGI37_002463 [Enterococcus sp. AZ194]|uniref:hypothetical protein n=1 Tax=Enterococcus sp. AZ194 TaxID=2774629 RepID=UPI003F26A711